ncbi:uncharacterized protein LOC111365616 [Olea europaea var. sylvestris]|uniref:uncharacterized protein LOC111365616 n=1 Tax=Olea europaea var. sylvestris TaxID=158386 RepID=UPI000C1D3E8C|nr:uncharacterized protein LOC111365616 [Olea europaea var. sylvestris]
MVFGLSGVLTTAKGSIKPKVESGSVSRQVKTNFKFVVFDSLSPYDAIMGQPLIFSLKVAVSLYHYSIKFPTPYSVGEVKGNRELIERYKLKAYVDDQCNLLGVYMAHVEDPELSSLDARFKIEGGEPIEELDEVQIEPRCLRLEPWRHGGIDANIACHKLQVDPSVRPKQQKRRPLNPERYEVLNKEVQKLLRNGFLREAKYSKWAANPVLVKKYNKDWKVCIDFTDLNKAYPKDSFSLPRIDQMVDATEGYKLLNFIDAYSGYNQIPMYGLDQEHTSFVIDRGLYCYRVMSFGLKKCWGHLSMTCEFHVLPTDRKNNGSIC